MKLFSSATVLVVNADASLKSAPTSVFTSFKPKFWAVFI